MFTLNFVNIEPVLMLLPIRCCYIFHCRYIVNHCLPPQCMYTYALLNMCYSGAMLVT